MSWTNFVSEAVHSISCNLLRVWRTCLRELVNFKKCFEARLVKPPPPPCKHFFGVGFISFSLLSFLAVLERHFMAAWGVSVWAHCYTSRRDQRCLPQFEFVPMRNRPGEAEWTMSEKGPGIWNVTRWPPPRKLLSNRRPLWWKQTIWQAAHRRLGTPCRCSEAAHATRKTLE